MYLQLMKLGLPDHWMKQFFLAHTYLDLQLSDQSAEIYSSLLENGFENSSYVTAQLAVAYDNMKSKYCNSCDSYYVSIIKCMFV